MTSKYWLNLPVKDLSKSKAFFDALGFSFSDENGGNTDLLMMHVGSDKHIVNLIKNAAFKKASRSDVSDPAAASELLISIDAPSNGEVDAFAKNVTKAGGDVFAEPKEDHGFYGCAFADLDGHRWNVLCMPKKKNS